MSFKSHVVRAFLSLSVIVSVCAVTFADTIRLKDGSTIKGKIVGFAGGKFTIATSGTRRLTVGADEVESIQFDSPQDHVATVATSGPRTNVPVSVQKLPPPPVEEEDRTVPEPIAPQKSSPAVVAPTRNASFGKPVELSVKVLSDNTANGWTNSGWVVKKGQKIRISGSGEVSLGRGKKSGPSGVWDLEDSTKLLKSVPTGALIAVIGDDNNEFIYVGAEREFTATRDGALFLGVNEGNLNDNTGIFEVKVEISPDGGE